MRVENVETLRDQWDMFDEFFFLKFDVFFWLRRATRCNLIYDQPDQHLCHCKFITPTRKASASLILVMFEVLNLYITCVTHCTQTWFPSRWLLKVPCGQGTPVTVEKTRTQKRHWLASSIPRAIAPWFNRTRPEVIQAQITTHNLMFTGMFPFLS